MKVPLNSEYFTSTLDHLGLQLFEQVPNTANATIHTATHTETGSLVVIKELDFSTRCRKQCFEEAEIMSTLHHKHIVALHDVIEVDQRLLLVMQLGYGGDLFEYISQSNGGRLEVSEAKRIFVQLISALQHMHQHGIVHLDVKPDNIFLDENHNVLLGDFGLSQKQHTTRMTARGGTLHYAAPETFLGGKVWGPELDVWSAGVVLYVMLRGCYPFWAETDEATGNAISFQEPLYPLKLPLEAVDLMKRMMCKNPAKRITINQIKKHAFVRAEFEAMQSPMQTPTSTYNVNTEPN